MSNTPSALEFHIYATDGEVTRFVQDDAAEAQKILSQIQPNRLFAQKQIIIAGLRSLNAFQTSAVGRIDLIMEGHPGWPFHHGISDAVQITEAEFRERYRPEETGTTRTGQEITPGQSVTLFAAVDLLDCEGVYLEVSTKAQSETLTPIDTGLLIQQFFAQPVLHARRQGGGAILINPANVVRLTFFPGPRETPPGAWPARYVAG